MKGTCCSVQCNLVQENFLRLLMNRESNHEQSRLCSCVGPNASKHSTGALSWPAADKWITSCENNKLDTEAEKIRALSEEKESTYFQPSKILHTKWSGLRCKYQFDNVCVCRQTYASSPSVSPATRPWLTGLIVDCEGEPSDKTHVTTAEGHLSALLSKPASFKLPPSWQGRILKTRENNTRKPRRIYFVTGTCYCLCSVA